METGDMSVIERYEVLTAAMVMIQDFSDVLLCQWMNGSHHFKETSETTHPTNSTSQNT
jgi:hypothetical protein